ncbi:MAG: ATP-binding protein [Planctomycetes bacterium]|nr:ATP-binding protein [Planctomycetota bacterium]
MAFLSGPRQVGKTTLARNLISARENYFLFDDEPFRRNWIRSPRESIAERNKGAVIFDEIHKDRQWKRRLKGIYDISGHEFPILVTGSARLDHFRKGSDSLLGRYLPYRLHPFTVAEKAITITPDAVFTIKTPRYRWKDLVRLGGFPEPLLHGNEAEAIRWSRLRLDRIVYEDSRDFLNISDLTAFRILIDILPRQVGSLLSLNSLKEDVGKAYATIRSWFAVLDTLYYCFLVRPYAKRLQRAIRAEPKMYLYDILRIPKEETGRRRENLVALHLVKACQYWTDLAHGEFDLRFVRDKEKREVDFLLLRDGNPWMLVECKSRSTEPTAAIERFASILKPKHTIQLADSPGYDRYYAASGVRVMNVETFLAGLV